MSNTPATGVPVQGVSAFPSALTIQVISPSLETHSQALFLNFQGAHLYVQSEASYLTHAVAVIGLRSLYSFVKYQSLFYIQFVLR